MALIQYLTQIQIEFGARKLLTPSASGWASSSR